MTVLPRERILTAVAHKRPDRTPTAFWLRKETMRLLKSHFKTDSMDDVYTALGVDWCQSVALELTAPYFQGKQTKMLTGDMPGADQEYVFGEDGTFTDGWGVCWRVGSDRKYVEHVSGPFAGENPSFDRYQWPEISAANDRQALKSKVHDLQKQWYVTAEIDNVFKRAWILRGMEDHMMDYYINPDYLSAVYDKLVAMYLEQVRMLAGAGVDCLCVVGDVATQRSLMLKPEMWCEFDKPRLAELIAEARRIKPDIDVFFHSDGNIWELMDDLIEIGFNIINPFQPESMDCAEVKRKYGDRIVLHGCATCQRMATMTPEEIRTHVTDIIGNCGASGGLILMPSNMVPFDTPLANILEFYRTARRVEPPR